MLTMAFATDQLYQPDMNKSEEVRKVATEKIEEKNLNLLISWLVFLAMALLGSVLRVTRVKWLAADVGFG